MTDDPSDTQPPKVRATRHSGLTDLIQQEHALRRPMAGTIRSDETEERADTSETWEIEQGTDVLCRDGEKVGEVVDIRPGYLVVEQGFFDPKDIYVPIAYVARHDDSSLTLAISREEFDHRDWSREPAPGEPDDETAER